MDEKEKQNLFVTLENIRMQVNRLVADAESEKENRKIRNEDVEKRLRSIEDWKNETKWQIPGEKFEKRLQTLEHWKSETKGKVSIIGIIVTAVISLAIYIILWLITKK